MAIYRKDPPQMVCTSIAMISDERVDSSDDVPTAGCQRSLELATPKTVEKIQALHHIHVLCLLILRRKIVEEENNLDQVGNAFFFLVQKSMRAGRIQSNEIGGGDNAERNSQAIAGRPLVRERRDATRGGKKAI
jgi:hypothetical protein